MQNIRIATAQFEMANGDKAHNLNIIRTMSAQAKAAGADVISFHECSISGYTFARHLDKQQMLDLAEFVPDGPSIKELTAIARENDIVILAGLFEKDRENNLYKPQVVVDKNGFIAKFRKIHPFINPHLTPGNQYVIFD